MRKTESGIFDVPASGPPFPRDAFDSLASAEASHWWFRARNRILLWVLESRVGTIHHFLEVGCGTGFVLEAICRRFPGVRLKGTEYFEEGLVHARRRVPSANFEQMDACLLNDVARFDLIGAFDVIEHIQEDELVLRNLSCALDVGGKLLVTVPQHTWLWSTVDERACHVRRYTRQELVDKVRRSGLEVEYVTSFVSLLLPLMWFSRLRSGSGGRSPRSEFEISGRLNRFLEGVMSVEIRLLKMGLTLPAGGSLLLLAGKA